LSEIITEAGPWYRIGLRDKFRRKYPIGLGRIESYRSDLFTGLVNLFKGFPGKSLDAFERF
jgi:hypothetical protein